MRRSNEIIERMQDGSISVDISTKMHPEATMLIDYRDWMEIKQMGGVYAARQKHHSSLRAYITVKRSTKKVHRIILDMMGIDGICDHHNGNALDNRRLNLRKATHAQNVHNSKRVSESGYKGVHYRKRSNRYRVCVGGVYYGIFDCKHEAAHVANIALKVHHGEFAYQNRIPKAELLQLAATRAQEV